MSDNRITRNRTEVLSPMIPRGQADFLVVLAPSEVEVNRGVLRPGGLLIPPDLVDEKSLPNRKSLNVALLGVDHYRDTGPLLERLRELDLWAQVQVEGDQLCALAPMLRDSGARLLFDHGGRPRPADGLGQAGFETLLGLAGSGRAVVKLSGWAKVSQQPFPHGDVMPYARALLQALPVAAQLAPAEGTVLAFREISEWKFSKPVFFGDTIHVEAEVIETKAFPRLKGGNVAIKLNVLNQRGEVVVRAVWTAVIRG